MGKGEVVGDIIEGVHHSSRSIDGKRIGELGNVEEGVKYTGSSFSNTSIYSFFLPSAVAL